MSDPQPKRVFFSRAHLLRIYPIAALAAIAAALATGSLEARGETLADARADAWAIAVQSVFLNTAAVEDREYLLAGSHQFAALWARDFSMSVAGALSIGAFKPVHDSLDILFEKQRGDGLLPRAVDNISVEERVVLGLVGLAPRFAQPLQGWFETENDVIVLDTNLVIPWAASRYLTRTHDLEAARKWFPAAQKAFALVERDYFDGGLVAHQPPYSDWEDSIRRTGKVALTNIYYVLAMRGASEWANLLGRDDEASIYLAKAQAATRALISYFWLPVQSVLLNFEGDDHLTADANLMAIVHHILPPELSIKVLSTLRRTALWRPMPGRPTVPLYPGHLKDLNVKLSGISDYHDGMYWLWLTALAAEAESTVGNCAGYERILNQLSARVSADQTFHEVYRLRGFMRRRLVPTHSLFYRAEQPLTWSAAMYLEAASMGCRSSNTSR